MKNDLHLVCPHCQSINRVPTAKLSEHPNCGRCQQPLFTGEPIELTTLVEPDAILFTLQAQFGRPVPLEQLRGTRAALAEVVCRPLAHEYEPWRYGLT